MWESVDVFVTAVGDPVEGVLVRIFSADGVSIFTDNLTDSTGKASFLLPVGSYSMRFYKFGANFKQPQLFDVVVTPPGNASQNVFDVEAVVFSKPLSTDPRLCRCSGFFRDLNGGPKRYLDMHFTSCFNPLLLDGAGVVSDRVMERTNENGYAELDLIRGGEYLVTIEAMDSIDRKIRIPDAPSANLPDVILPVVETILLDVVPGSLAVDEVVVITPTVLDSSGVPLKGTAVSDVLWSIEDLEVASLVVTGETLVVTGKGAGSTQIVAVRKDKTIVRIPDTPIEGVPIPITVL